MEIKANILKYVKAQPEQKYKKISDDFGTNNIVYEGTSTSIDGNGHINLKQFVKA